MDTKTRVRKWFFFESFFSLIIFTLCLYLYVEKQNYLTYLRMEIPKKSSIIRHLKEEIVEYEYEVDQLESPMRLMQLASSSQFSHLVHPYAEGVLTIKGKEFFPKSEKAKPSPSFPAVLGTGK